MKKQYLFVAVAVLALGLLLSGCDLFDNGNGGGSGGGETYEDLIITGQASDGKSVQTIFSTTRSSGKAVMPKPVTGDTYKILLDNAEVSRGGVDMQGAIVTFKPSSGGSSFEAILGTVNSKYVLNFPDGIRASNGSNIAYVNSGVVNPEFDTDLDATITLSAGQTAALTVIVKPNSSGGAVSYQWYKAESISDNGTAIAGANGLSYTVSGTATAFYYVKVINASGGVKKSNVAKVVVGSNNTEIIVGGSGGVRLQVLKDVINYMLGTNTSLDYTVTFAEDPKCILIISPDYFPGTGKVTIKSDVILTKGIHITRSNVELNGLKVMITSVAANSVPPYYTVANPCAILISDRYSAYTDPNTGTSVSINDPAGDYDEYTALTTINKVAVVGCSINIFGSNGNALLGICVDPYTAGRTASNRAKITGTEVYVENTGGGEAWCFYGNHADLSDNTFTANGKGGAVKIVFLFGLRTDNMSFTRNKFINSSPATNTGAYIAEVNVNNWDIPKAAECGFEKIGGSFYDTEPKFGGLESKYRQVMNYLFDQAPNNTGKPVALWDWYETMDLRVFYRKQADKYQWSDDNTSWND